MHHELNNSKLGDISFDIERFPSCCGISIIKRVYFHNVKDKKKLYYWFYNTVLWGKLGIKCTGDFVSNIERSHSNWKVNKIIMADRTTGHGFKEGNIYEFCMSQKNIIKGTVNDNPNSSYHTQSFELNRPKNKYNQYNGTYLEPVVDTKEK